MCETCPGCTKISWIGVTTKPGKLLIECGLRLAEISDKPWQAGRHSCFPSESASPSIALGFKTKTARYVVERLNHCHRIQFNVLPGPSPSHDGIINLKWILRLEAKNGGITGLSWKPGKELNFFGIGLFDSNGALGLEVAEECFAEGRKSPFLRQSPENSSQPKLMNFLRVRET